MGAGATRSFAIPASACNIPSTAAAYSVNVTVVPEARISFLSVWATGSAQAARSPRPPRVEEVPHMILAQVVKRLPSEVREQTGM